MNFGQRIRDLRHAKNFTLRDLADRVGVGFTYISKIENHKLEEGHCPSEKLIHKLAVELEAKLIGVDQFGLEAQVVEIDGAERQAGAIEVEPARLIPA